MEASILIPVFGGQGTSWLDADQTSRPFLQSPSATVLIDACHAALKNELAALSSGELEEVGICISDFAAKDSILCPGDRRRRDNPALAGSSLSLLHSLYYMAYVEGLMPTQGPESSFTKIIQSNIACGAGVLGFSSGIISACVVATSSSIPSFIFNAVEAYRLALWIGIRSTLYRSKFLKLNVQPLFEEPDSWCTMLTGLKEKDAMGFVKIFNEQLDGGAIALASVLDDDRVTVSGCPYDLTSFAKILPEEITTFPININALYHRAELDSVRNSVLADIASRNIRFPVLTDLMTPVLSTFDGELIFNNGNRECTLAEKVVDMVLIHPVRWDLVVEKSSSNIPKGRGTTFLNIGIGPGIMKHMESIFHRNLGLTCQVITASDKVIPFKPNLKQEPVAIIGMAVSMPCAPTVDALWDILECGRSTLSMIPEDRFDSGRFLNGGRSNRMLKTNTGNFIDDIAGFDHSFFNISAREARCMDPQQRILLEVGYHALENAGYVPHSTTTFNPDTFGCFIGAATHDYIHNLRNDIDIYYSTGTLTAFLSGRLSYCLGLSGPSMVIDTACSSSMVAIHQAVRALMNRDCHAVLAGGVNVMSSPDMFIGLEKGHFLSPTGQCKSFDASADGYARSEGCGIFVLKRLSDALAENDQVLGIIRGIEINQSGTAQSITHPHIPTQEALFRRVLSCSDIESNSVSVVEAHGTGTQAGDISELESIRHVLAVDRMSDNPLYVTSIKANIGHLEAASGCASLAKVLLMFKHKTIPQQISLKTVNPRIAPLDSDNIIISKDNIPWLGSGPRFALINNFGAAGSNAALVLEEYIPRRHFHDPVSATAYIFGISAKDLKTLEVLRSNLIRWLQTPQSRDTPLSNLAYTTTARRQLHRYRLAHAATSQDELIKKLTNSPVFDANQSSPIIFVFSGQGSHYRGMGRSLYGSCSPFKRHIDECDFLLISYGFSGILSSIMNDFGDELTSVADDPSEQQSAIFALEYSLAKLWLSWGLKPEAVMGHSLGEYVALVIAGVISLKDALLIVAKRARLMGQKCAKSTTGMVAVSLSPGEVDAVLNTGHFPGLSIACFNSPRECVVSGTIDTLRRFVEYFDDKKIKVTQLRVPFGYHSPAMSDLWDDLSSISEKTKINPPRIPFISTVLGKVIMPGNDAFPPQGYFAMHCIQSVRLIDAVNSYQASPIFSRSTIYLEIGPHPTVLGMLQSFPSISSATFVGSLQKGQDPTSSLSVALAVLYVSNCDVHWRSTFRDLGLATCVSIPPYPFAHRKFWVPFVEKDIIKETVSSLGNKYSLLRGCSQISDNDNGRVAIFETSIRDLDYFTKGHRVGGIPLCPASVYLELAYEAVHSSLDFRSQSLVDRVIVLHRLAFKNPLTCHPSSDFRGELHVSVDAHNNTFSVASPSPQNPSTTTIHADGTYTSVSSFDVQTRLSSYQRTIECAIAVLNCPSNGINTEIFSARTIYQVIFPRVVEYSTDFHTLRSLTVSTDGMEATGIIQLCPPFEGGQFVVPPPLLDSLLHTAGFLANLRGNLNDAYICNEIGAIHVLPAQPIDSSVSFTVYSRISTVLGAAYVLGETYLIAIGPPTILIAHFEGIRFQRVRLSGLKAGLAVISGTTPAPEHSPRISQGTPNPSKICELIAKSCGMDALDITMDHDLDQLGVDSLMRLELSYELSNAFPAFGHKLPDISRCGNVKDLVDSILEQYSSVSPDQRIYLNSPRTPTSSTRSYHSSSATLVHSQGSVESPVKRILANILDLNESTINNESELNHLGFDSFASIEALHVLKREYNLEAPRDLFSKSRTIADVEYEMNKLGPSLLPSPSPGWISPGRLSQNPFQKMCEAVSATKPLVLLQNVSSHLPPLVLIHDGSGLIASYERLPVLGRRVWAISNPRLSMSEPWRSVIEMAEFYANLIFDEIEGPIILGGWSFGGVVAFEVSRQLKERSVDVQGVLLIDAPNPSIHVPIPLCVVDQVLSLAENLEVELRKLCKTQFLINSQLLSDYLPPQQKKENDIRLVFLRSLDPYIFTGQNDVPMWLSNRRNPQHITAGWDTAPYGRLIRTMEIPGHHFEPFNHQNIAAVSRCIKDACAILDGMYDKTERGKVTVR